MGGAPELADSAFREAVVNSLVLSDHASDAEELHDPRAAGVAKRATRIGVSEKTSHRGRESRWIVGWNQESGDPVHDRFGVTADTRRDNWLASRHRFEDGVGESLLLGRV